MNVKLNFDTINVFEANNPNYVKVLMLKGEKGEKGDPGSIVNQYSTSTSDAYSANYINQNYNKDNMGNIVVDSVTGKNLNNGINQYYFITQAATNCGTTFGDSGIAIKINGKTSFTISTKSTQTRYRVGCVNDLPSSSAATTTVYNGVNKDGTSDSVTINTTGYTYLVVNATNLNDIQVELGSTVSDYISYKKYGYNSEESMGSIVVDDVQCKNLFDKSNAKTLNAYTDSTQNKIISNDSNKVLYIPCKPNTTYTISKINDNSTFNVAYTTELPANNVSVYGLITTHETSNNRWYITITTGNDAKYLVSRYIQTTLSNKTNQEVLDSIQIEKGSEATSYVDYKSFDSTAYVLWTNPDDTQSFANQLVTLNDALANYKYYEIIYKRNSSATKYMTTGKVPTNKQADMITNLNYNYLRTITEIWANSFRISDCVYYATYGSTTSTQSNTFLIPYQILGYK